MKYDVESINKRKEKEKKIKMIIGIIAIIMIYNIILIVVSSINGKDYSVFGYKAYIIDTNSMSPTINIGDIVIVKKVEKEKLNQSDVITFSQEGEVITHRIIKVEADFKYVTKGDNNNTEDTKKVKYEDILGEEILIIPYLGKAIQIIDNKIIFLIICLIILICAFINIQKNEKLENRREKKKIEDDKKKIK